MDERAHGLILRTLPLTETSLIVHWITAECGRMATVANGARRPKSTFRGKLDLFFEAEISYARSRRSDLHTLREVVLMGANSVRQIDLMWLNQMSHATALIEQTTEIETPIPELFALLMNFRAHLGAHLPSITPVLAFELKLLRELGLDPSSREATQSKKTAQLVATLTTVEWGKLSTISPEKTELRDVYRFLHDFMLFHLGKIPKTRVRSFPKDQSRLL